uniref:SRCR domain-containing protein n=1 Tax=Cyprinus carpio TaxID=7962 RepID=A0A8C1XRJ7_CYPCA
MHFEEKVTNVSFSFICSGVRLVGGSHFETVRLVGGNSSCSGRVEVLYRGQWGTVCHNHWDKTDVEVVCRELDCGEALNAVSNANFGQGSGPIWMDQMACSGSESTLKDCRSLGWGVHNCGHHEDAVVICSGELADGPHLCSGRLEVLDGNTWYTVCDAAFDQQDAEVVCRELDCGAPVQVLGAAAFGKGDTQMWTQEIQCRGNESLIRRCPSSTSNNINCTHDNHVELMCYTDLRLVNGPDICSGRVERQYFSKWGTVCDACWDMRAASVLCRQLNCGIAVSVVGSDWFGEGSDEIWADVFDCDGNETKLSECSISSWSRAECSHSRDVGVICSGRGSIRLVGSGGDCAGRLEVFHSGSWGTVCDDSWDIKDAHVVCRQLQCGVALSNQQVPAWFGPGSGPIWLDEVECEGNETSLWSCSSPGWGKHDCQHKDDVGVVCSEHLPLRLLVGGHSRCSGRVEVLHRGQWGTVCDLGWGLADAAVVCRELDCGEPVDALGDAHFGQGSGPIWMSAVCTGSESTLKSCWSGGWGKHNCDHSKDAGVICSEVRLVGGSRCSGRLEILHNQMWMSVCDAAFDQQDAEVVCRELDCGAPVKVLGAAAFDKGDTQMWTQEIQCRGNESQIHLCPISLSVKKHIFKLILTFSIALFYTFTDIINVRLVNGSSRCAGRVEVLHRGQWGTVCDAGWDLADAAVVCRELDCGEPVDALVDAHSGPVSGPVWIKNAKCTGSESTLKKCGFVPLIYRGNRLDKNVQVICSGKLIIPYYSSRCSGRLEILHNQTWMSVCEAVFDQQDAEVVCREMDCGAPVQVLGAAAFGKGAAQMWTQEIQCRGNESQIHLCPTSPSHENNCSQDNGVGLVCAVRLVGGSSRCAGRVEVLHRGQWGTVCGDGWDLADAAVVCRELDCGEPVDALGAAHFGQGSGKIWTNPKLCNGSELTLKICPSVEWGYVCDHTNDAGVICSGTFPKLFFSLSYFTYIALKKTARTKLSVSLKRDIQKVQGRGSSRTGLKTIGVHYWIL